jgi:hypothetical protein
LRHDLPGNDHHLDLANDPLRWNVLTIHCPGSEVVGAHIASNRLQDGIYDTASAQHLLRGVAAAYCAAKPGQLSDMRRSS